MYCVGVKFPKRKSAELINYCISVIMSYKQGAVNWTGWL